jgi:hypothetical protein
LLCSFTSPSLPWVVPMRSVAHPPAKNNLLQGHI